MAENEMVERVARALCRQECEYPGITYSVWDDSLSAGDRDKYRAMARAAIEAMREPTKPMVWAHEVPHYGPDEAREAWRAMIDAALSPEEGK